MRLSAILFKRFATRSFRLCNRCELSSLTGLTNDASRHQTSANGLFPRQEADSNSDTDTDSCTMQDFSTGLDSDSDPLTERYVIGIEICPWDRDPSLKWVQ